MGIFPLVKLTACFRYLAYGDAKDREDENLRVGESTLDFILVKDFCKLLIKEFGDQYLNRHPTEQEKKAIIAENTRRGFPGMLASWDCISTLPGKTVQKD